MTDIPDHLRWISIGEEIGSICYEERDRNRHIIPQVDGTVDSRDSLNWTPDSIDLTVSPVKYRNEKGIQKRLMKIQMITIQMKQSNLTKTMLEKLTEKIEMNREIYKRLMKI